MELAYSFHVGRDKNRGKNAKEIAKDTVSNSTSMDNNGIQNSTQLSKINKHNLRDYENNRELIRIIYGSDNLYNDVKNMYLQEFEQARIEYNEGKRKDRQIENYFQYISKSSLWDLGCEIIIELGDMNFWEDKDTEYKLKMVNVYKERVEDLMKIVPNFKVANAVIHFDEKSPHMHIVGVPVTYNNKRGMKKQVGKSKVFTKESLSKIQDEMRKCCIKSYNRVYEETSELKKKQKGRNRDVKVKDMGDYQYASKQYQKNIKTLEKANDKTDNLLKQTDDVDKILKDLKPSKLNKNNKIITNEQIEVIQNYTKEVKNTTKSMKIINSFTVLMNNVKEGYEKLFKENQSLKNQVEEQKYEINELKEDISFKDSAIDKLHSDKEKLEIKLDWFSKFWHGIMKHFQNKIGFDKDKNYEYVAEDLYKNEIFDDNENEIANNTLRKIKTAFELEAKNRNGRVK